MGLERQRRENGPASGCCCAMKEIMRKEQYVGTCVPVRVYLGGHASGRI